MGDYFARVLDRSLSGRGSQRRCDCPVNGCDNEAATVNLERNLFYCHKCHADGDVLKLHQLVHGLPFLAAARDLGCLVDDHESVPARNRPAAPVPRPLETSKPDRGAEIARELLRASDPLAGSVAEMYLHHRAAHLPPDGAHLRYHRNLRHAPTGSVHPVMLAPITHAVTGKLLGVHRTYLSPEGRKADVKPSRMVLGRKAGGVIRLWPDEAVTTGLGIAEGIETALSLAHGFTPVWATIDAGNMAAFPVLEGIECLTIAADHDEAGLRAAETCAQRWHAAGREVRLVMAPNAGADLNDVARECVA